MLAEIDVLGHIVTSFRVVLVYGRVWLLPETHVLEKVPQVSDLDCHLRCRVVFRFRRRQRHGLLHFRTPLDIAVAQVEPCQEASCRPARDTVSPNQSQQNRRVLLNLLSGTSA
jgi:hypothetical protein